uniref:Uncharacterized protein n=1 Tax=Candidatus Methanophagaceae archaeon ANME-1 ERB6 TaxID=2759912 RepID=A0A7G9YT77_9EURY|nr:hypothetical protein BAILMKME_00007 [Methanosarcinales archaeon ANME-1 ERB6]
MATKIRVPSRVVEVLEKTIERTAVELMAIGLYRDGKITLRQAADLVSVDAKEMLEVFEKHDTYLNYGIEELEEDISYAKSGERF